MTTAPPKPPAPARWPSQPWRCSRYAARQTWILEYTDEQLKEVMKDIHGRCREAAEEYGAPGDYVSGANIAGFVTLARALTAQGLI
jgi:glutamate dehydrogenase (NADP+)